MQPTHPITSALILLMVVVPASGQSGRGRQLQIQEKLHPVTDERGLEDRQDLVPRQAQEPLKQENAVASRQSQPSRGMIYNSGARNQADKKDDDYHMTRGDKIAGWILLGWLALTVGIMIANDGDF